MDAMGARILRDQIAERQWSRAPAVRERRQPATDPDEGELELVDGDLRVYRSQTVSSVLDGRPSTVRRHLTKRLVDGTWESSYVVERADPVDEPAA